jgi:hypothetical protein
MLDRASGPLGRLGDQRLVRDRLRRVSVLGAVVGVVFLSGASAALAAPAPASVTTSFACTAPAGSGAITSCTDSNAAASPSGTLDTSTLGTHAYTVTTTSNDTLTASTTIHYTVVTAAPPTTTTTTTTTTPTTTTPTTPTTPPVQLQIATISATATTIVWCQAAGRKYPTTSLQFALNRATTVRLLLRTHANGRYRQVATTTLHGHQGIKP